MTKVDISRFDYENLKLDNQRLIEENNGLVQKSYAMIKKNHILEKDILKASKDVITLMNKISESERAIDIMANNNLYLTNELEKSSKRIENLEYELKYDMVKEEVSPSAMRFIKDYID
jgi:hypothetical protein